MSAVLAAQEQLLPALVHLRKTLDKKGRSLRKVVKTGRTHLMDAMPLTFEQEFGAWSAQLASAQERIEDSLKRVRRLPLGGTAIGTGINADPRFGAQVAKALKQQTGFKFDSAENKFEGLAAQDDAVELSGQLNALAVALIKIANDLRWMNAGPLAGLGEIELPALQPGSSIMPGKVNPVIPEATVMACAQVIGHHTAITVAGQTGNFQLNVTLPLIAVNLLDGIGLLANVAAAGRQRDCRAEGARRPCCRGAVAQSHPGHGAEPDHRLREGSGHCQACLQGTAPGAGRSAGRQRPAGSGTAPPAGPYRADCRWHPRGGGGGG